MDGEHVAHFQNAVADEQVDHALDERKGAQRQDLACEVVEGAQVVIALAAEHGAVADDFIGAAGEAQEHGDHQAHEQVGGNVEGAGKGVVLLLRVAQHGADEQGQHGRLQQRGEQVGTVAQLAEEGTPHHGAKQDRLLANGVLRWLRRLQMLGRGISAGIVAQLRAPVARGGIRRGHRLHETVRFDSGRARSSAGSAAPAPGGLQRSAPG